MLSFWIDFVFLFDKNLNSKFLSNKTTKCIQKESKNFKTILYFRMPTTKLLCNSNGYYHRKWKQHFEFKSRRLFTFYFILMPLRKAWIHLFFSQLGVSCRAGMILQHWLDIQSRRWTLKFNQLSSLSQADSKDFLNSLSQSIPISHCSCHGIQCLVKDDEFKSLLFSQHWSVTWMHTGELHFFSSAQH